jgi:hypothetical protein
MITATVPQISTSDGQFYTLLELAQAIEAGFAAAYDDPNNYGLILVFKERKQFTEGIYTYYTTFWGDDPEETRSWARLECHFNRLSYRVQTQGWQLVSRESLTKAIAAMKAREDAQ